ncbi:hypothetical protein [Jonesia denitrificans]|uniref:DUF3168 domain-containing protein n=1 Tax=Jonesia denitrificans (strain ATCC 14870 / DSM 20603 / BCRC 15368 / CIP 55.134 / JCM 11481 / NBRC 15587 / NCTC 10816 / Prevot 55134) TaxID=471856 RepID=C7R262_JONDD|nr:hypothetical protein [Jonesia denitrificans]ACV09950.1 hypothetical protein Jden_2315 [Jonesia denitrificans DSM 20603]ASE08811.1 hypothetical protein CEP80_06440 [Jonesia denitrificans]ASE08868.1 hypothetical protein CEP80_06740 [Jonesia denitrificans]SQH22713.1 Uncharacterised protein [Jonesia denitrificans]
MVNIESLVISHLNTVFGAGFAFGDVPADRPTRFATVERTGGPYSEHRDLPLLVVQCWESTRHAASELALTVRDAVNGLSAHPNVGRVRVTALYNFPDGQSGHPRYQMTVEMVTKG